MKIENKSPYATKMETFQTRKGPKTVEVLTPEAIEQARADTMIPVVPVARPGAPAAPPPVEEIDFGPDPVARDPAQPPELDLGPAAPVEMDFGPVEEAADPEAALENVMWWATRQSEPSEIEAATLAEKTGLPVSVVRGQVDVWKARWDDANRNPKEFIKRSPALAGLLLKRPDLAPALMQDREALEKVENGFANDSPLQTTNKPYGQILYEQFTKRTADIPEMLYQKGRLGRLNVRLRVLADRQRAQKGVLSPEDEQIARETEAEMAAIGAAMPDDAGVFAQVFPEVAEQGVRQYFDLPLLGHRATEGAITGLALAGGPQGIVPGAASGLIVGVADSTARTEGALFYRDLVKDGVEHDTAEFFSHVLGAFNGAVEAAPLEKILRLVPGAEALMKGPTEQILKKIAKDASVREVFVRAAKRMGEGAVWEATAEGIQAMSEIYLGSRARGGEHGDAMVALYDDLEKGVEGEIATSIGKGGLGAIGMSAVSPGVLVETGAEIAAAQEAKDVQEAWKAIGDAAKKSKSKELRGFAKVYFRAIQAQHGTVEKVAIPADKLTAAFQAEGYTEEMVAEAMPEVARQMAAVQAPTEEVIVPIEDMAVLAPMSSFGTLTSDIRINDKPTAREMPEVDKISKDLQEERTADESGKAEGPLSARRTVLEKVRTRLIGLGVTEEVATHDASLWAAFAHARAVRKGTDAVTEFDGFNINFARGEYDQMTKAEQKKALLQASVVGKGDLNEGTLKTALGNVPLESQHYAVLNEALARLKLGQKVEDPETRRAVMVANLGEMIKTETNPTVVNALKDEQDWIANAGPSTLDAVLERGVTYEDVIAASGQEFDPSVEEVETLFQLEEGDMQAAFQFPDGSIHVTGQFHDYAALPDEVKAQFPGDTFYDRVWDSYEQDTPDATRPISGFATMMAGEMRFYSKAKIKTLFQQQGQTVKGFFQQSTARDFLRITLTGKADESTFLHESAHAFMAILERDAMQGDAYSAGELATIKKWLGVKGKSKVTRAQYEKFARGFEAYLREGKAPSTALAEAFRSFKAWLKQIYATLRRLNVELDDSIRQTYDRLLATEVEIENAKRTFSLVPPAESAELAGMTPEEYTPIAQGYVKAIEESLEVAERETLRHTKQGLAAERAKIKHDMEQLSKQEPMLVIRDRLMNPDEQMSGKKMDRAQVRPFLKGLTREERKRVNDLTQEDGLGLELASYLFVDPTTVSRENPEGRAFVSGEALIKALAATPTRAQWVEAQTETRMREKHPGYEHSRAWQVLNAQRAIHTASTGNAIWAAHVALGKKVGALAGRTVRQGIQKAARDRAAKMAVIEMESGPITRAEAAAALEVAEAWKKGDHQTAFDATRRQLYYHLLWKELDKGRHEVNKIVDRLRELRRNKKLRGKINKGDPRALAAIDALLDKIDIRGASDSKVELSVLLEQLRAEGHPVVLPKNHARYLRSFKLMPLEDLRTIKASVENLEHAALAQFKKDDGAGKLSFAERAAALADYVRGKRPPLPPSGYTEDGWREYFAGLGNSIDAHLRKVEFLAREVDGGATAGWFHANVMQPIADAEAREHAMLRDVMESLHAEWNALDMTTRIGHDMAVTFLGKRMKRRNLLAIALNLRNQGNIDRLLASEGWTLPEVLDQLDQELTDADISLINKIGMLIESFWPEIEHVYRQANGTSPKKVQGNGVTLPSGRVIEGGYYPVIKSPDKLKFAEQALAQLSMREADRDDLWDHDLIPIGVEHGFAEGRAEDNADPLHLSLDAVPTHIAKVIHYVTHYEATTRVDKLLRHASVQAALIAGLGKEKYAQFRPWLLHVARNPDGMAPAWGLEKIFRHYRLGATVLMYFFKTALAMKQALGIATTFKEFSRTESGGRNPITGSKYIILGFKQVMSDFTDYMTGQGPGPFEAIGMHTDKFVLTYQNYDRDMRAVHKSLTSAFSTLGKRKSDAVQLGMWLFNRMQGTVNAITWQGAKRKAQAEGHPNPAAYADAMVRMSQSSGGPKDLAAIQTGSEFVKAVLAAFSWRNAMYNQLREKLPPGTSLPKAAYVKIYDVLTIATLPIVALLAIRGAFDDDDDKGFLAALLEEHWLFLTGLVPIIDRLGRRAVGKPSHEAPWVETVLSGTAAIGKGVATIWNDEEIEALLKDEDGNMSRSAKDVVNLVGMTTHLPTQAGLNLSQWLDEYVNDTKEDPLINGLLRTPGESK